MLFGYFFLLTSTQHLLRPAKNAFFLSTAGPENLPWAYIASAVASALAAVVYGRVAASLSRSRQVVATLALVIVSLIVFWMLLIRPDGQIAGAFYVWTNVFSLLLVSQFFLISGDLFDPRQAKRVFGFIGVGGLSGGVVGSAAAGFLSRPLGAVNLLPIAATLLIACTILVVRVLTIGTVRETRQAGSRHTPKRSDQDLASGFRSIKRLPHLRRIATLVFVTVLVSTFIDWMFSFLVESAIPDREAQAEFFGRTFAVFNGLGLIFQLAATGAVLRLCGLAGALLILPMGMGLGAAGLIFVPGLIAATAGKGFDMTLRHSIDQSARELLYLPVPTAFKQRAKPFIDVVLSRSADGVAGVLILLGSSAAGTGVRPLAFITLGLVGVWLATVLRVRGSYQTALERLLAVRDVDLVEAADESLDTAAVRELRASLRSSASAADVHYTLDLLRDSPAEKLRDDLLRLLEHPDSTVRARAITRLLPVANDSDLGAIRPLLDDTDPKVRAQATILASRFEPEHQLARMTEWLESTEPNTLEAALACFLAYGDRDQERAATDVLNRLIEDTTPETAPLRAACARALARLPSDHPHQGRLTRLLADDDPAVVRAAIWSAGTARRVELLEPLVPHLKSAKTRRLAIRAMASVGDTAVPHLSAFLRDPTLPRRWLPSVLVEIATPAAFFALADSLPFLTYTDVRSSALKALNKLRRRHPSWELPTIVIRRQLESELFDAYDTERQLLTLSRFQDKIEPSDTETASTYAWALGLRGERSVERAFRLEALLHTPRTIYFAYAGLTGGRSEHAAHAIELLETALDREDARVVIPLIDADYSRPQRIHAGRQWFNLEDVPLKSDLTIVLERGQPWLKAYAAPLAHRVGAAIQTHDHEEPLTRSTVEKAAALRHAKLMRHLDADDLLQLAAVAEERSFDRDEHLFYEGEAGEYLYVVLDGEVRGERGELAVFKAGVGDVIGEFSILDQRPRSISMVATEPTQTLAIHRDDMIQVMADNYTLVEGLFRHLTQIIREMNELVYPSHRPSDDDA
ncbi:MAG: cyclic nucleotide-binding domain-containing protein [Gemmatimonadota bacterium]